MNIFENATRRKFGFTSVVGVLTVTELWDLPLTSARGANLNDVAKAINRDLKMQEEDTFVSTSVNTKRAVDEQKLELVKYIIAVKQQENAQRIESAEKAKRKEQLLTLLAKKKDEILENKTLEEIQAEFDALA